LDLPAKVAKSQSDKRKTNVFSGNPRSLFALQCFDSSFQFINTESPPLHRTPPQKSENSYYNGQDRQHQSRRPLIKPGHGNLLSVRLNVDMKGDYSQPGLMPGRFLEPIDLTSAYLFMRLEGVSGSYNLRRWRLVSPLIPIGRSLGILSRNYKTIGKSHDLG
jgi:hypothetical protein